MQLRLKEMELKEKEFSSKIEGTRGEKLCEPRYSGQVGRISV